MAKLTLSSLAGGYADVTAINTNADSIETALENTLSRDGTAPNAMSADLDMNSNNIINLATPTADDNAANKAYVDATAASFNDGTTLTSILAASTGSSLVGHIQSGTGAVERTVQVKLREWITPQDYGAVGNGVADDTTPMFDFFTAAIAAGRGHIPAGTYLIDEGILAFDNAHVDTAWPDITTDGHESVIFKASGTSNAAMLAITNGTAASGTGQFWLGGSLGGITFLDETGASASSRHGLLLRGVWHIRFGVIAGEGLRADVINIPALLYGGTNPDPYHVAGCSFDGIRAVSCVGWALHNLNYVGFHSNHIRYVYCVNGIAGGWYGVGTMNSVDVFGVGNCSGWALDDAQDTTGGGSSRLFIKSGEFDNVENGIRLNQMQQADIEVRVIHRFQYGLNTDADYWPRECVSMGGAVSPSVNGVRISLVHRTEAGGVLADLGTFFDGNSSVNIGNVSVDHIVNDSATLGVVDATLFTGISANSTGVVIMNRGRRVADSSVKVAAYVRSATTETVPNAGIGTDAATLVFATELYDRGGYYNNATYKFTVPFTGLYRLSACIHLNVAAGTRVRMEFSNYNGATRSPVVAREFWTTATQITGYALEGVALLTAGHVIDLLADQNTAGAVNLSAPRSATSDNYWSIVAL